VSVSFVELTLERGPLQDLASSWQVHVPAWRARAKKGCPSHWAKSPQRSLATNRPLVSGLGGDGEVWWWTDCGGEDGDGAKLQVTKADNGNVGFEVKGLGFNG